DASGGSCVAQIDLVTVQEAPGLEGVRYSMMYARPSLPSTFTDGGRASDVLDLGVRPGAMDWKVIEYAPGMEFPMHHTDTYDFDTVLSGSVDLILDDGAHPLAVGDNVVVTGVDHAWRAGPDGCRLSVISIGVAAPG